MWATATGKTVAELIGGRPPHLDPAPFSPRRFLRSLMAAAEG